MQVIPLKIAGAYELIAEPFKDHRGLFERAFCARELKEKTGMNKAILQVNHSVTARIGALRGMHYQLPPKTETKIVKSLKGSVYDVILDLRKNSVTFKKWVAIELTEEKLNGVLIPDGCAHGFQVLRKNAELLYFHTEFYSPEHEAGVRYDDPAFMVDWPLEVAEISKRDQNHPLLSNEFEGI